MIAFGSLNVSGVITIRSVDANDTVAAVNLTGMTLEAWFWDVGRVGKSGETGSTAEPLMKLTEKETGDDDGLVVSDAETGVIYLEIGPANASLLRSNSIVCGPAVRRLEVEIWRVESETTKSRLWKFTEWAEA